MSIFLTNWKIFKTEEGSITVSAWIADSEHKKLQLNSSMKDFSTGNSSMGRGISSKASKHHQYGFTNPSIKRMKATDPLWKFDVGSQTVCFSFGARASNARYGIQTLEEIEAITEC